MLKLTFFWAAIIYSLVTSGQSQYPYTIEKEEFDLRFYSAKTKYDQYSTLTNIEIESERIIKINTEDGARIWKTFRLPEALDPIYRDISYTGKNAPFYLDGININLITIKIKRNRSYIQVKTSLPKIQKTSVFRDRELLYGKVSVFDFDLPPLRIGDEIHIHNKISFQPQINMHELGSFRVFFHGKVPKHNVIYRISKTESAMAIFNYENGAEPHNSFKADMIIDKWRFDTLPAALNETNGQAQKELPHVQIVTDRLPNMSQRFEATDPDKDINFMYAKPYYSKIFANRGSLNIGSTYRKITLLNTFVSGYNKPGIDKFAQLSAIFNSVADFKLESDSAYFSGDQLFEPNIGLDLEAHRIRMSNRFELYAAILDATKTDYLILSAMDKRVGQFSNQFFKPIYNSNEIFGAISETGQIIFISPKSRQCGLYVDELPFYYEDTDFLISYSPDKLITRQDYELTFNTRHRGWSVNLPKVHTPGSTSTNNQRSTTLKGKVDLDNNEILVNGRISLKGQFSTITRSNYLCDEPSPFVDPQYNELMWETIHTLKDASFEVIDTSSYFPFETRVKFDFTSQIQLEKNGILVLDLSGWINHINLTIDTADRLLDFYLDFQQIDKYSFMLELPDEFECGSTPPPNTIQNSFGNYQFKCECNGQTLQVFSQFSTAIESVKAEEIEEVREIYDAMERAENLTIYLNKK